MAARPAQDGRTLAWVVRWVSASAVRRATKEARENGGIHRRHVMLPIGPADSPARSRAHSRPRPAKPFGTNRHNPNQRLLPEDDRQDRPPRHSPQPLGERPPTHCEEPHGFRPRAGHLTIYFSSKNPDGHMSVSNMANVPIDIFPIDISVGWVGTPSLNKNKKRKCFT